MFELFSIASLLCSELDDLVLCLAQCSLFPLKVVALLIYDPVQIVDSTEALRNVIFQRSDPSS